LMAIPPVAVVVRGYGEHDLRRFSRACFLI
jgi:hypothetical protein